MSAAAHSGAYAQKHPHPTFCNHERILELDQASGDHYRAAQEPSTSPAQSSSDEDIGDSRFFEDAFHSPPQSDYFSPEDAHNQIDPYPLLAAESATHSVARDSDDIAYVDAAHGQEDGYESGAVPTISQSQSTTEGERNTHSSIDYGGDDSGQVPSTDPSTLLSVDSKELHVVAQEDPGLGHRLAGAREYVPHTPNLFSVDTSQYVPGHGIGGKQKLHDEVDDMVAVAAADRDQGTPQEFACEHVFENGDKRSGERCNKVFKTKESLRCHVRIHNEAWTVKRQCPECDKGFRHPYMVRRHVDSVHSGKKACPNCGTEIADRADAMKRHQTSRRCRTAASSSSTAVSGQPSRRSASANSGVPAKPRPRSSRSVKLSTRGLRVNPEASG